MERAGRYTYIVFPMFYDCLKWSITPPQCAKGWSAVCGCGISRSYSLNILYSFTYILKFLNVAYPKLIPETTVKTFTTFKRLIHFTLSVNYLSLFSLIFLLFAKILEYFSFYTPKLFFNYYCVFCLLFINQY